jgi:hypothetical protein
LSRREKFATKKCSRCEVAISQRRAIDNSTENWFDKWCESLPLIWSQDHVLPFKKLFDCCLRGRYGGAVDAHRKPRGTLRLAVRRLRLLQGAHLRRARLSGAIVLSYL